MTLTRRHVLLAPAAGLATGAAARPAFAVAAAGQPAALLIAALRPDALAGWPREPGRAARTELGARLAALPVVGELNAAGRPADLEALIARRPRLVLDYGDLGPRWREAAERIRRRTRLDARLIDGRLTRTPQALSEAGRLLGAADTAASLARWAEDALTAWSGLRRTAGPRFYYGRGADGLEAGLPGSLSTEVLEGAGWRNVVREAAPRGLARVSLEQVLAWDPEVVVTLDPRFARRARADALWGRRRSGRSRKVVLLPSAPFGWIDRPPSLNRLLGCIWAASAASVGGDPQALAQQVRAFYRDFYHRDLGAARAYALAAASRAS